MSPPRRRSAPRVGILLAAGAALLQTGGAALSTEEPSYVVIGRVGAVEVREYAPVVVAETLVEGDFDRAGNAGFRRLAAYIFGGNRTRDGREGTRIAMTAPVGMRPSSSQRIEMTAPVGMRPEDGTGRRWLISFVMPSEWTLATLPEPRDPAVALRALPARTRAALAFSGTWSEERFAARGRELVERLAVSGWRVRGAVESARYDPPWTPWFLRRNEVLVEVERAAG